MLTSDSEDKARGLANSVGVREFRELVLPFQVVATDLDTGGEVVLSSGNLLEAMRARMDSAADEFQVPLDAMPLGLRDEFLNGGRRRMFEEFTKAVDAVAEKYLREGMRVRCHPERGVELNFLENDRELPVPVSESWGTVALTEAEARELSTLLEEVSSRFRARTTGRDKKEYVMVVGLAPVPRK